MITVDFKKLRIRPNDRILDIGCGSGRHADGALRFTDVRVFGADLNFSDLQAAKERLAYLETFDEYGGGTWAVSAADITALPYANGCFDHVICSEVMEHVPNHEAAAAELNRVLKPGGNLVISVPRYLPEKICWMLSRDYGNSKGGHIRIYRKDQISSLFEKQGLRQWGFHFAHSLHTPFWWLKCLVGLHNNDFLPVSLYHRLLTWDIMEQPKITRFLDRLLNPVMGKSLVVYLRKS